MFEAALTSSVEGYGTLGLLSYYAYIVNGSASLAADWSSWLNQNGSTCSNKTALFRQRTYFMSCYVYPYISHEISQGNFTRSANLSVDLVKNITLAQDITGTIYADPVHVTAKPDDTATTPEPSCTTACVHNPNVHTPNGSSSARVAPANDGSTYQSLPPEPDIELERLVPHH